jgi:hypothetical protein
MAHAKSLEETEKEIASEAHGEVGTKARDLRDASHGEAPVESDNVAQAAPQMKMPPAMRSRSHTALALQPLPLAEFRKWLRKVILRRGRHGLWEKRQRRSRRKMRLLFLKIFSLLVYRCLCIQCYLMFC